MPLYETFIPFESLTSTLAEGASCSFKAPVGKIFSISTSSIPRVLWWSGVGIGAIGDVIVLEIVVLFSKMISFGVFHCLCLARCECIWRFELDDDRFYVEEGEKHYLNQTMTIFMPVLQLSPCWFHRFLLPHERNLLWKRNLYGGCSSTIRIMNIAPTPSMQMPWWHLHPWFGLPPWVGKHELHSIQLLYFGWTLWCIWLSLYDFDIYVVISIKIQFRRHHANFYVCSKQT